mmetsp:Transcript_40853/g.108291  ORF Transcript_40853/g.108291 Transcript_40853/m.108291 type:complete len:83 (-) Transcript_40853:76-324(-)
MAGHASRYTLPLMTPPRQLRRQSVRASRFVALSSLTTFPNSSVQASLRLIWLRAHQTGLMSLRRSCERWLLTNGDLVTEFET